MIQFNLLPDVKIELIKSLRLKRTVLVISVLVIGVSIGLLIIMFSFSAVQKKHVSDLDKDIAAIRTELENISELTKILSVQNQLNTLPGLYDGRPAVDRLPAYIDQTTPVGVNLTRIQIDFSTSTAEISGTASRLDLINSYVDTLKYTNFRKSGEQPEQLPYAFSTVVLKEFARTNEEATFTVTYSFDPTIFSITETIELVVPQLVTTRAEVPSPDLFNGAAPTTEVAQ